VQLGMSAIGPKADIMCLVSSQVSIRTLGETEGCDVSLVVHVEPIGVVCDGGPGRKHVARGTKVGVTIAKANFPKRANTGTNSATGRRRPPLAPSHRPRFWLSPHAERLDHHRQSIADATKAENRFASGHVGVDFHYGVIRVHFIADL
jgi:hypothetical protein